MLRRNLLILLLAGAAGIVFISLGCDDLVTQTIKTDVRLDPTAEYSVTPDSGCVPLTATFTDASSGPIKTWIWYFGDSTKADTIIRVSPDDNGGVTHTFSKKGAFTVKLVVIDSVNGGVDDETKKRAVIVGNGVDSVSLSSAKVCPGEEVKFTAHNPYIVRTWRWDFGDGTILTDDSVVQTHSYAEPGYYKFKLTVTGECGIDSVSDSVQVLHCATPSFTAVPDIGCVPLVVAFTDSSKAPVDNAGAPIGNIVKWKWDFGNGITYEFNGPPGVQNISYATAGTYPVTLTVTTDAGGVTSYQDTIVAYPSSSADFTAQPDSGCQVGGRQFLVAFNRVPTGDTTWLWEFGDGDTSHAQNPYHAYTNPGTYTVKLTVRGACGADTAISMERKSLVSYSDQLTPINLWLSDTLVDTNFSFTAADSSASMAVVRRVFKFGTANPDTTDNGTRSHSFSTAGTYWVKLTRFNYCGELVDSASVRVVAQSAP